MLELSLSNVSQKRITFLCGEPGPLSIQCLLNQKLGRSVDVSPIIELAEDVCDLHSNLPDELLYGRSGYLFALLYLRKELGDGIVPSTIIRKVVEGILKSGQAMSKSTKSRSPLMFAWHEKIYIGAAHGLSGILAILLQSRDCITPAELNELGKG